MKVFFSLMVALALFSACWPTSVSFKDKGSMDPRWKNFMVKTLDNNAANAPLSYGPTLSEALKDGVQNNTRLKLVSNPDSAQINIEGAITNYMVTPIALQAGDVAAKNRLTISTNYTIYINVPRLPNEPLTENQMTVSSTRFADYDSYADFSVVESQLIEEINKQIVQDVINKLLSNW